MISPSRLVDEAEVVVVGAGPAGTAAAAVLASEGIDVLVLDRARPPRDKPCGDALTRSAVECLDRLGLEELVRAGTPIEGRRIVIGQRAEQVIPFRREPGRPLHARCIRRRELDAALLEAARARGARFRTAEVERPLFADALARGVAVALPDGTGEIRARHVIAADGAASAMRSGCGLERGEAGAATYAIRTYLRTERPLAPYFDFYAPVRCPAGPLAGPGWVFPVDDHVVNAGVSFWHATRTPSPRSMEEALICFVEELAREQRERFGELEQIGRALLAPLGSGFSPSRCEAGGVLFVGDAARTTDPLSGQGTANALLGAEQVARALAASLRRGGPPPSAGAILDRRFPRLDQELSLPVRVAGRHLERVAAGAVASADPFLTTLRDLVASQEDDPALGGVPLAGVERDEREAFATLLESFNEVALEELRTRFPFARELLHRELRADGGPLVAATTLAVGGAADADTDRRLSAALTLELLWLTSRCVSQLSEPDRASQPKLNNALAVLVSDFALGRAFRVATRVDVWLVARLAPTLAGLSEAQFQETRDLFSLDRTPERYLEAASGKRGALVALAAQAGARLAGLDRVVVGTLQRFGHELGVAYEISRDVVELLRGDEVTGKRPGQDVANGYYSLPVLHALRVDPELRGALGGRVAEADLDEVVARVVGAGGVDFALAELRARAGAARAILEEANGGAGRLLHALVDLPEARTREAAHAAPVGPEPVGALS